MKPTKGKTYYIDYHDGPDYTHYHGPAKCIDDQPTDIDGICYGFAYQPIDEQDPLYFPEESIVIEVTG